MQAPATGRRSIWTAAATLCVLAGALAVGVALDGQSGPPPRPAPAGNLPAQAPSTTPAVDGMPPSPPTTVQITDVDLKVPLVPVRISGSGQLPLPKDRDRASWLASSVTPGERGSAILAGHVDSADGPAAFYNLSAAKPGMQIAVTRRDGTTARFTIDAVAVYPKDKFPDSLVYGPTPGPSLRLITCTGWDPDEREYRDNVVVYATPHTKHSPK